MYIFSYKPVMGDDRLQLANTQLICMLVSLRHRVKHTYNMPLTVEHYCHYHHPVYDQGFMNSRRSVPYPANGALIFRLSLLYKTVSVRFIGPLLYRHVLIVKQLHLAWYKQVRQG